MTIAPLYEVSTLLVDLLLGRFLKVEAHDVGDLDSCDMLWIEVEDDESKMSVGEVIKVSPFMGTERWHACHDGALRFGGWPTYWDKAGTAEEVLHAVSSYLAGIDQQGGEGI